MAPACGVTRRVFGGGLRCSAAVDQGAAGHLDFAVLRGMQTRKGWMARRLGGLFVLPLVAGLAVACGGGGGPAVSTTPTTLVSMPSPTPSATPPTGCTRGGIARATRPPSPESPCGSTAPGTTRTTSSRHRTPITRCSGNRSPSTIASSSTSLGVTRTATRRRDLAATAMASSGCLRTTTCCSTAELSNWQHKFCAANPGKMSMCAKWDGVYSNCIAIKVVSCEQARPPYLCN